MKRNNDTIDKRIITTINISNCSAKKEEISINLSGGDFFIKKLFPLTTQIAFHGEENEGIEQKLNESNKFAGAAQRQAAFVISIDCFMSFSIINHLLLKYHAFSRSPLSLIYFLLL